MKKSHLFNINECNLRLLSTFTLVISLLLVERAGSKIRGELLTEGYVSCDRVFYEEANQCNIHELIILNKGRIAEEGLMPWMVSLQDYRYETPRSFCGGVIIHEEWVLTAAFCVWAYDPENIKVVAGESDTRFNDGCEQVVDVQEIIVHEEFYSFNHTNDVALLRVWPRFLPNWKVSAIPLNENATSSNYVGDICRACGWGLVKKFGVLSPLLLETEMKIISDTQCKRKYPNLISSSMFCAVNGKIETPCSGDWGSPLVCNETDLVGIASWSNVCGRKKYPIVFVAVRDYITWIAENID